MNRQEAAAMVAGLCAAYPWQEIQADTASVYARALEAIPAPDGERAVRHLIATSSRFPSIATILETAVALREGLPSPAAAWEMIAAGGKELPPAVRRALDAVGGRWAVRTTENTSALRAQFLGFYRDFRAEAIAEAAGVLTAAGPRPELEEATP